MKSYNSLLLLIVGFHFINNFIWLKISTVSRSGADVHNHLILRNEFYWNLVDLLNNKGHQLKDMLFSLLTILNTTEDGWPRLVYFVSSIISLLFGNTPLVAYMFSTFYFFILIISVYLIGKECAGKTAGILAAFLISFYPAIFGLSRSFGLDFPLTAMTALSILLLLKTDNFKDTRYSLLFGIVLGLGIMTKAQMPFFMFGPICYIFYRLIVKEKKLYGRVLFNIAISFLIAVIISSLFWYNNLKAIFVKGFYPSIIPIDSSVSSCIEIFTFKWFFFYLFGTIVNISPVFFLLLIGMIPNFLKSKIKHKEILLSWLVAPYIILTIFYVKNLRYYLPSFPSIALISSFGILRLKQIKKRFVILLVMIWGIYQFFSLSYISQDFLPRLIKQGRLDNFYNDYDELFYPIRNSDNFLDIAKFLKLEIEKVAPALNNEKIKIGGIRFGREPRYMAKIISFLGFEDSAYIYRPEQGDKQTFDFLIVGLPDKDIQKMIIKLKRYNPDLSYRVLGTPYHLSYVSKKISHILIDDDKSLFNTTKIRNKKVSDFIFLLKLERNDMQSN